MINRVLPCDFLQALDVYVEVAHYASIDFTITDPCCRVNDCKMVRAVIAGAFHALQNDTDYSIPASENGATCCCEGIPNFPDVDWYFGDKNARLTLYGVSGPSETRSVSAPWCNVR